MIGTGSIGVGPIGVGRFADELPAAALPAVLTQAIVERGPKNADGSFITAVAPAWYAIIGIIERDPQALFQIPPAKWEEIIAGAYERAGFTVTLTPRSGDFGRDVIAEKSGWGSVRFIDQVKAYKPGHLVTAEEVRALVGVLHADRKASKGLVTTTSDFAPRVSSDPSIAPFMPTRLELVNGNALWERLAQLKNQPK